MQEMFWLHKMIIFEYRKNISSTYGATHIVMTIDSTFLSLVTIINIFSITLYLDNQQNNKS